MATRHLNVTLTNPPAAECKVDKSVIWLQKRHKESNSSCSVMIEEVSTRRGPRASTSIRRCSMRSFKIREAPAEFWPPFRPSSWSTFSSYRNSSCLISIRCSETTSSPQQSLISCSMRLRGILQVPSNLSCRRVAGGASVVVGLAVNVYSRVSARNRPSSGVKISVDASSLPLSAT